MRIVTCSRNTITSPISKCGFNLIKQLRETIENTTSNTTKFVNEISLTEISANERFVSLDIEDLFTNIPVRRAVDIVSGRIGASEKFCETTLTKTDVKQLLLVALNNSYFQFEERFYRQKRGLPMGNTLSPLLADIYMHEYMTKHMNEVCQQGKLWRYVDDILMITTMSRTEVENYVGEFNSITSQIRFTVEQEKNDMIN